MNPKSKSQPKPIQIPTELAARCDGTDQAERMDTAFRAVLSTPHSAVVKHTAKRKRHGRKSRMAGERKCGDWSDITSGIGLIQCSRLAHFENHGFIANTDSAAFEEYWTVLDPVYGRWFCWLAFFVGAESIGNGAFGLRGINKTTMGGFSRWERIGISNADDAKEVRVAFTTLKKMRDHEAHQFKRGVRSAYFPEVPSFIQVLNKILACLDRRELERQLDAC